MCMYMKIYQQLYQNAPIFFSYIKTSIKILFTRKKCAIKILKNITIKDLWNNLCVASRLTSSEWTRYDLYQVLTETIISTL